MYEDMYLLNAVITGEMTGAFAEHLLLANSHWTPGAIGLSMLSVTYAYDGWWTNVLLNIHSF